jgi:hypothetical protein
MRDSINNRLKLGIAAGVVAIAVYVAPTQASANQSVHCTPDYILEVTANNFIRIRCEEAFDINGDSVRYFVVPTTNSAQAARFISLGSSSMLSGITFYIEVDTNGSNNPSGCSTDNCRYAEKFGLIK